MYTQTHLCKRYHHPMTKQLLVKEITAIIRKKDHNVALIGLKSSQGRQPCEHVGRTRVHACLYVFECACVMQIETRLVSLSKYITSLRATMSLTLTDAWSSHHTAAMEEAEITLTQIHHSGPPLNNSAVHTTSDHSQHDILWTRTFLCCTWASSA